MASILDKYKLDDSEECQEIFEGAIAVGISMNQLLIAYRCTPLEMDKWCVAKYGMNFKTTYEAVKQGAINEFLHCVNDLGCRGNPTALGIINEALRDAKANQIVKITFDTNLPLEGEEDKLDKGD